MGAPFHADWRSNGVTINVDLEQQTGETTSHFIRRIIDTLTDQLNQHPPDNT